MKGIQFAQGHFHVGKKPGPKIEQMTGGQKQRLAALLAGLTPKAKPAPVAKTKPKAAVASTTSTSKVDARRLWAVGTMGRRTYRATVIR